MSYEMRLIALIVATAEQSKVGFLQHCGFEQLRAWTVNYIFYFLSQMAKFWDRLSPGY